MKSFATAALLSICVLVAGLPAQAQNESFRMYADSTMDGNDGTLMWIIEAGDTNGTAFLFEDGGMIRVYAFRDHRMPWEIITPAQFLVPASSMAINDFWRALDEDDEATTSTVVAQESITVPAGTFPCYRIEVVKDSAPSQVIQEIWFSDGFGLIKQTDTFPDVWVSVLFSYQVPSGSGFFPLGPGNMWNYQDVTTPVESKTWGAVKALYE
jgi:hypothetical protein